MHPAYCTLHLGTFSPQVELPPELGTKLAGGLILGL